MVKCQVIIVYQRTRCILYLVQFLALNQSTSTCILYLVQFLALNQSTSPCMLYLVQFLALNQSTSTCILNTRTSENSLQVIIHNIDSVNFNHCRENDNQ